MKTRETERDRSDSVQSIRRSYQRPETLAPNRPERWEYSTQPRGARLAPRNFPTKFHEILQSAIDRALLKYPKGKGLSPIPSADPQHEFVQGLTLEEAATLLNIDPKTQPELIRALANTALSIKESCKR